MFRRLFSVVFALCFALLMNAATWYDTSTGYSWEYVQGERGVCISSGRQFAPAVSPLPEGNLRIPSYVGSQPVVAIGESAFFECKGLASVDVPSSVQTLGQRAFGNCYGLRSVSGLEGLRQIGKWAFIGCGGLLSLKLPEGLMRIEDWAFGGCVNLRDTVIPNSVTHIGESAFYRTEGVAVRPGNAVYSSDSFGVLFDKEKTLLIQAPLGLDGTYTVPATVEVLGVRAFSQCDRLLETVFSGSLREVGAHAYAECDNLERICFPRTVTTIGEWAFSNCIKTEFAFLGNPPALVGQLAFPKAYGRYSSSASDGWRRVLGQQDTGVWNNLEMSPSYILQPYKTVYMNGARWKYEIKDGEARLFDGNPHVPCVEYPVRGHITVPTAIEGYPVKTLPEGAFTGCSELVAVTVPDGIERIGDWAFSGCMDLRSVDIADSITDVSSRAFYGCPALPTVGGIQYESAAKKIVVSSSEDLKGVAVLPGSVRVISAEAFFGQKNLTGVRFPVGLRLIGEDAFFETGLTSADIPATVRTIEPHAFAFCENMKSLRLHEGLEEIGAEAFRMCGGVTDLTVPASVKRIGETAFGECRSLESLTYLPSDTPAEAVVLKGVSVRHLTSAALYGAMPERLESVTVPEGVREIEAFAFLGCPNLETVVLPEGIEKLGEYAFCNCERLVSVRVPGSLNRVGQSAFEGCGQLPAIRGVVYEGPSHRILVRVDDASLTHLEIPGSVRIICSDATSVCPMLRSVTIPQGVVSVEDRALALLPELTSLVLPESIRFIGREAFTGCRNLQSVSVLSSDLDCEDDAFADVAPRILKAARLPGRMIGDNLETLTIPAGGTDIEAEAFIHCTNLTSVCIPEGIERIGAWAFSGCEKLQRVVFPGSLRTIGMAAFDFSPLLSRIDIGERVTHIGDGAFVGSFDALFVFHGKPLEYPTETIFPYGASGEYSAKYATAWRAVLGGNVSGDWAGLRMRPGSGTGSLPYEIQWVGGVAWKFRRVGKTVRLYANPKAGESCISADTQGALRIPGLLAGLPLTEIPAGAFAGIIGLTDAEVPASVGKIASGAFVGCTQLRRVTGIASGIPMKNAFVDCPGLRWTLKVSVKGDGSVSGTPPRELEPDRSVRLTAKARPGSVFGGWYTDSECKHPAAGEAFYRSPSLVCSGAATLGRPEKTLMLYALFAEARKDVPTILTDTLGEADPGQPMRPVQISVSGLTQPRVSAKGLPAGVTFDAGTLRIAGTPKYPGDYDVLFSAVNASGYKSEKRLRLKVTHFDSLGDVTLPSVRPGVCLMPEPIVGRDILPGLEMAQVQKVKVSGLPHGIRFSAKTGAVSGACVRPGAYTVYFSLTEKDPVAGRNATRTSSATWRVLDFPRLTLTADVGGVVRGEGNYPANRIVTLKAVPDKKYAFAGWKLDGSHLVPAVDSRSPSVRYRTSDRDETVHAVFVREELDTPSVCGLFVGEKPCAEVPFGVSVQPIEVRICSQSLPKVTLAGLPAGLKFDAKTREITGTPKTPGTYRITVTVRNASSSVRCPVLLRVSDAVQLGLAAFEPASLVPGVSAVYVLDDVLKDGFRNHPELLCPERIKVSGLPPGFKYHYDRDTGRGTIAGMSVKPGFYTVWFKQPGTDASGRKTEFASTAVLEVLPCPQLNITCLGQGRTGGAGCYPANKKIRLTASPRSGNVFAGWYTQPLPGKFAPLENPGDNPGYDFRMPAVSYMTVTNAVTELFADFRPVYEEKAPDLDGLPALAAEPLEEMPEFPLRPYIRSLSLPKVTVRGLPDGVKYDARRDTLCGVPSTPGRYSIAVTAVNAAKKQTLRQVDFRVLNINQLISVPGYRKDDVFELSEPGPAALAATPFPEAVAACLKGASVRGQPEGMIWNSGTGQFGGGTLQFGAFSLCFTRGGLKTTMDLYIVPPPPPQADDYDSAAFTHDFSPQWPAANLFPGHPDTRKEMCFRNEQAAVCRMYLYPMKSYQYPGEQVYPEVSVDGLPPGLQAEWVGLQGEDAADSPMRRDPRPGRLWQISGCPKARIGTYAVTITVKHPEVAVRTVWEDMLTVSDLSAPAETHMCGIGISDIGGEEGPGGFWGGGYSVYPVFAEIVRERGTPGTAHYLLMDHVDFGLTVTERVLPYCSARNGYSIVADNPWWAMLSESAAYDRQWWPTGERPDWAACDRYTASFGDRKTPFPSLCLTQPLNGDPCWLTVQDWNPIRNFLFRAACIPAYQVRPRRSFPKMPPVIEYGSADGKLSICMQIASDGSVVFVLRNAYGTVLPVTMKGYLVDPDGSGLPHILGYVRFDSVYDASQFGPLMTYDVDITTCAYTIYGRDGVRQVPGVAESVRMSSKTLADDPMWEVFDEN